MTCLYGLALILEPTLGESEVRKVVHNLCRSVAKYVNKSTQDVPSFQQHDSVSALGDNTSRVLPYRFSKSDSHSGCKPPIERFQTECDEVW